MKRKHLTGLRWKLPFNISSRAIHFFRLYWNVLNRSMFMANTLRETEELSRAFFFKTTGSHIPSNPLSKLQRYYTYTYPQHYILNFFLLRSRRNSWSLLAIYNLVGMWDPTVASPEVQRVPRHSWSHRWTRKKCNLHSYPMLNVLAQQLYLAPNVAYCVRLKSRAVIQVLLWKEKTVKT